MNTTEQVIALVRETLGLDEATPIRAEDLLFYDLGFTSMDLLDLLFRLEDEFGIELPEGTLFRLARGEMSEEEFCDGDHLTPAGRKLLMALLHDTPPAVFPEQIHRSSLPRFCTVGAFVRLVEHERANGKAEACSS